MWSMHTECSASQLTILVRFQTHVPLLESQFSRPVPQGGTLIRGMFCVQVCVACYQFTTYLQMVILTGSTSPPVGEQSAPCTRPLLSARATTSFNWPTNLVEGLLNSTTEPRTPSTVLSECSEIASFPPRYSWIRAWLTGWSNA